MDCWTMINSWDTYKSSLGTGKWPKKHRPVVVTPNQAGYDGLLGTGATGWAGLGWAASCLFEVCVQPLHFLLPPSLAKGSVRFFSDHGGSFEENSSLTFFRGLCPPSLTTQPRQFSLSGVSGWIDRRRHLSCGCTQLPGPLCVRLF